MSELIIEEKQTAPILAMVERVAMSPDADMDKLERLLDMQERVLSRDAEMAYNAAMSALQADLPAIHKSADGHNSKYAKFETINETIRPHLAKHGFSVSFRSSFPDGMLEVTGIIAHKSGHREETSMHLPFDKSGSKNDVQAIGSSVSYGKRYVLCMLLNISTSDDDDGVSAVMSPQATINDLLASASDELKAKFFTKCGVDSVDKINQKRLAGAISWLRTETKNEAAA